MSSSRKRPAKRIGILKGARRFLRQREGGVLVYTALAVTVFLGVSGLAVDVSVWHAHTRSVQSTADAAAMAAVLEMARMEDADLAEAAAEAEAVTNGYSAGDGDTIDINNPPEAGEFLDDDLGWEVLVRRPVPNFLSSLVFSEQVTVLGRAVATSVDYGGPCIMSLDTSKKNAMKINSGNVETTNCTVQVNSDDPGALGVPGTGSLTADEIDVVGGVSGVGNISSTPNEGASAGSDPMDYLTPPDTSGCDETDYGLNSGSDTLSPGVYCGGIDLAGDANVTLDPGTYVIKDGSLKTVGSDTVLTGDGVTIYFEGDADVQIAGNGSVDLKAPTTGDYTGVLFYGDPNAPTNTTQSIVGSGDIHFDGVMYFPTAKVNFSGNGAGQSTVSISAIFARELNFSGNGTLSFHFDENAVVPDAFSATLRLVE